ncbi:MAG: class I SAM-dependent methyltransferase [Proteobacteria bacterium]|nr:class I SAM-dependent methyltransferase [Pseudomonadota bacterium]
MAKNTARADQAVMEQPLTAAYLESNTRVLPYLIANGLKPNDRFLDYGCAFLRTGLYVIPHLEDGLYCGADISMGRIERGARMLEEHGISRDRYSVVVIEDSKFRPLQNLKFDWIFSNSVIHFMDDDELSRCLATFNAILSKGGQVHVTFPRQEQDALLTAKGQFPRTAERLISLAANAGFRTTLDTYKGSNFGDHHIAVMTR